MAELRRALLACATDQDIAELYASMMKAAKEGDVQAARLLLDHLVGRPKESIEVSATEGASIDLPAIIATIMLALGDDEGARIKVAAAFHKLGSGAGGHG
jgi:hypothetical protein